jgi:hypothetical protein
MVRLFFSNFISGAKSFIGEPILWKDISSKWSRAATGQSTHASLLCHFDFISSQKSSPGRGQHKWSRGINCQIGVVIWGAESVLVTQAQSQASIPLLVFRLIWDSISWIDSSAQFFHWSQLTHFILGDKTTEHWFICLDTFLLLASATWNPSINTSAPAYTNLNLLWI